MSPVRDAGELRAGEGVNARRIVFWLPGPAVLTMVVVSSTNGAGETL